MATIDDIISSLQESIRNLEKDLGIAPGGAYPNARIRLDILESRINNPLTPSPNVENPFTIGNSGVTISTGVGYPIESSINGSLFLRQDGYEGVYFRIYDTWQPITGGGGGSWSAGGDLSGDSYYQTVIGLQNRSVSAVAPSDNQILIWKNSLNCWSPSNVPIIFDLSENSSNLRANRYDESSYVDNTKKGILNLGNSSAAYADYATIVGGLQNQCNFQYSFIGGGYNNRMYYSAPISTTDGYNVIVSGADNIISGTRHSSILNGKQNYVNGSVSTIVGGGLNTIQNGYLNLIINGYGNSITSNEGSTIISGMSNSISGDFSLIVNGYYNSNSAYLSSILNGYGNYIYNLSEYSNILNGNSNIIGNNTSANNFSSIMNGFQNIITSSLSTVINGQNNIINGENSTILNGFINQINSSSSNSIILNGSGNSLNSPNACISGNINLINGNASFSNIIGQHNTIVGLIYGNNCISGSFNNLFGDFSYILGENNDVGSSLNSLKYVNIFGNLAKANYNGQYIQSAHHIDNVKGNAQFSRIVMEGKATAGQSFDLTSFSNNLSFENNKSYDINLRVLIVNSSGTATCARFIFDILAYQQSGILTLVNINNTLSNDNSTGWSVNISTDSLNTLMINVPASGTDDRRAIATIEWREISRS